MGSLPSGIPRQPPSSNRRHYHIRMQGRLQRPPLTTRLKKPLYSPPRRSKDDSNAVRRPRTRSSCSRRRENPLHMLPARLRSKTKREITTHPPPVTSPEYKHKRRDSSNRCGFPIRNSPESMRSYSPGRTRVFYHKAGLGSCVPYSSCSTLRSLAPRVQMGRAILHRVLLAFWPPNGSTYL